MYLYYLYRNPFTFNTGQYLYPDTAYDFRALARPNISLATVAKLVLNFLATGLDILATVAN
jgi:hypothetical protein